MPVNLIKKMSANDLLSLANKALTRVTIQNGKLILQKFDGTSINAGVVGSSSTQQITDASPLVKGVIRLGGDLSGTADSPIVSGLSTKADLVGGLVPTSQLPTLALSTVVPVANKAAMLLLTSVQVQPGDVAVVSTDPGKGSYILSAPDPSQLSNWIFLTSATDSVITVNGQQGVVVLGKLDVGLGNVNNTADNAKPVSTLQANAIDAARTFAIDRANHTGAQDVNTITGLSSVSISGKYSDLKNTPIIPTSAADVGAEPAGLSTETQNTFKSKYVAVNNNSRLAFGDTQLTPLAIGALAAPTGGSVGQFLQKQADGSYAPGDSVQTTLDSIGVRAVTTIRSFTDWLSTNKVKGFVGELGVNRLSDTDKWNKILDLVYSELDNANIPAAYWATGDAWGSNYPLLAYGKTGSAVDTAYSPSAIIEAHPSNPSMLRGINVAGGEFNTGGSFAQDAPGIAAYPSAATFTYLASRGIKLVRIPFRWERLQPTLGAALNTDALNALTQVVTDANSAGLKVILDCHNYAGYYLTGHVLAKIGSTSVTVSHFADLWTRISSAYKANSAVVGYGLMNEPGGMAGLGTNYTQRAVVAEFTTTLESWPTTNGGVWSSTGGGSARYIPGTGSTLIQEPPGTNVLRDRSANGTSFWADVYIDAAAVGTWDVAFQSQDSSYNFYRTNGYARLTKGAVTRIPLQLTLAQAQSMRDLAFSVGGTGRNGTDYFEIRGIYQGDLVAGTPAAAWEAASQAAVTAIRNNSDTKEVEVAPYVVYGEQTWGVTHPVPWILDNSGNTRYEHHQYEDAPQSGLFANSYATDLVTVTNAGWLGGKYSVRGAQGPRGLVGPAGSSTAGQGVPTGGTSGQVLTKTSNVDYATSWATPATGGSGSGSGLNPYSVSIPGTIPPQANSSGTVSAAYQASSIHNVIVQSPSSSVSNWYEWSFVVAAGTYNLRVWHVKQTNCGIANLLIDGASVGTVDGYAGSYTANQKADIAGLTLTEGRHTLRFQMDTKNASATLYYFVLHEFNFSRTGA